MTATLPNLAVKLSLDGAAYVRGLARVESETQRVAGGMAGKFAGVAKAVSALGIGATLVQSIRSTAQYGDEIAKLSARAGVSATEISGLAYAARQADVDNKQLAKALRELGNDAQSGGKKLAELGISATDSSGKIKSSADLMREFSDVIARTEDPQRRAALAAQLLGDRLGPELIPLLAQGSSGLKDMAEEARKFGRIVDDEAAKAAERFNDNLTKLQEKAAGVANQMAGPLVQSLADASTYFLKVAQDVGTARALLISFGAAVARVIGTDEVGGLASQAKANSNAIALTVKQIENFQRLADRGVSGAADRVAELRAQYDKLQATGAKITDTLKALPGSGDAAAPKPQGADLGRPLLGGSARAARATRTEDPEAAARRYLDNLQRQLEATQGLTVVEATLRDIQLGRLGVVNEQQRAALLNTAAEIDAAREFEKISRQFADAQADVAARQRELASAAAAVFEATRSPLENLNSEVTKLDDLLAKNLITWDTYSRAVLDAQERFDGFGATAQENLKKTDGLAQQLGLTMASSFEQAVISGNKLSDVLKGLARDVAQIALRRAVTEPLGNAITKFLGNLSFDGGGYTGSGPRSGGLDGRGGFMAMLHPNETVIDHTKGQGNGSFVYAPVINAQGADAGLAERLPQILKQHAASVKASIMADVNRGGSAARTFGRA